MLAAIMPNLTRKNAFDVTVAACKRLEAAGIRYSFPDQYKCAFPVLENAIYLEDERLFKECDLIKQSAARPVMHSWHQPSVQSLFWALMRATLHLWQALKATSWICLKLPRGL